MSVKRIDITHRSIYEGGKSFGEVGPYIYLEGVAYFEIDPDNEANTSITDIDLAPLNENGMIEFSSDFSVLKPSDPARGCRTVLLDIVNRGTRTVLSGFNRSDRSATPISNSSSGNGFLMEKGYTIVFCGWQADVPNIPGLIGLHGPEALLNGEPLVGDIMNQYQANEATQVFPLADRYHKTNPAAEKDISDAKLFVGDYPDGEFELVSPDLWSLVRVEDREIEVNPSHLYMKKGFELGRIYQLVYKGVGSRLVGLGFAALRDVSIFLKEKDHAVNPLAGEIDYVISFGSSQSGRFLRQYLYTGMNIGEDGKLAMDGIIPHVAGGMRGEFNLRFGQPSKDVCYIMPGLFPFSDFNQIDPISGQEGGLLNINNSQPVTAKIMFTNTSAEYWRGDAALIHTNLLNDSDGNNLSNVRNYHFAGTQHGSGVYPPIEIRESDAIQGGNCFNAVDYSPLLRGLLERLRNWIKDGIEPPDSSCPSINKETAVSSSNVIKKFEEVESIKIPFKTLNAMRLDYGNRVDEGLTTILPPERGEKFPAYVSDVDQTLNEVAGIRLPDVSVPLYTNTGWNPRHHSIGNEGLLIGITGGLAGSSVLLPITEADRDKSGDPRPSLEILYKSKEEYMDKVKYEVKKLVQAGYLLVDDIEDVCSQASDRYEHVFDTND
tara:strand:+ start:175 stop:2157 length:1983 start_codon:yes stop_codon:yes gene_type:complete